MENHVIMNRIENIDIIVDHQKSEVKVHHHHKNVLGVAVIYVAENETPHLHEFSGNRCKVQEMVNKILKRLANEQRENLPIPPPFEVQKFIKSMGIYAKIDPENSYVENEAKYKLKFHSTDGTTHQNIPNSGNGNVDDDGMDIKRRRIDIDGQPQQQIKSSPISANATETKSSVSSSAPSPQTTEIHQQHHQQPQQQLGDFINGDGHINFDVFGRNLEQLFASGFIVISHKEIIRRTFECLKNGSIECVNFANFVAKMDECFSEEKICDAKKLIKKWAEWTNRKAIQMHKDVLIASNGNALQTIPTVDELAKSFEEKCAQKIRLFVGWTEKLITPEIRNKEWIVELENQNGIQFIGRSMEKLTEKLAQQTYANAEQSTEEIYVFFLENTTEEQNDQISRDNYELLLKLSGAGKHCIFVDLTMHSVAKSEYSIGRSHIALFQGSNVVVQDYLEAFKKQQEEEMKEKERKMNTCMARIKDKSNTFKCQNGSQLKKMSNVILELPCPKASEKGQRNEGEPICPDDDNTWECDDCGQLLYVLMPNNKGNVLTMIYHQLLHLHPTFTIATPITTVHKYPTIQF